MGRLTAGSLFDLIHDFLMVYLPGQKCASPLTVTSYRYAVNLYLDFICGSTGSILKNLDFTVFRKQNAEDFLAWMKRHKEVRTRYDKPEDGRHKGVPVVCFRPQSGTFVYLRGFSEMPRQKTDTWVSVF